MIVFDSLFILLSGVLDRYRGSDDLTFLGKGAEAFANGLVIAYLAGFEDLKHILIFSVLYIGAIGDGYGGPWGAVINRRPMAEPDDGLWHWWLIQPLRDKPLTALFARGLLGAAYLAAPCYFAGIYSPLVAMALGFPLSALIGRELWSRDLVPEFIERYLSEKKPHWDFCEFVRGTLIGGLTRFV